MGVFSLKKRCAPPGVIYNIQYVMLHTNTSYSICHPTLTAINLYSDLYKIIIFIVHVDSTSICILCQIHITRRLPYNTCSQASHGQPLSTVLERIFVNIIHTHTQANIKSFQYSVLEVREIQRLFHWPPSALSIQSVVAR